MNVCCGIVNAAGVTLLLRHSNFYYSGLSGTDNGLTIRFGGTGIKYGRVNVSFLKQRKQIKDAFDNKAEEMKRHYDNDEEP